MRLEIWGSTAPLSLQKATGCSLASSIAGRPWPGHSVVGGCAGRVLCARGPAHGWGIPTHRRSGELCLSARSPAG